MTALVLPEYRAGGTASSPVDNRRTLRQRLIGRAAGSRLLDLVLRERARQICAKTGLLDHVTPHGLCVDIGSGLGHLIERIVAHRPAVTCLGVDPQWAPAPALVTRVQRRGRARFCAGDGRALPLPDSSASTALVAFVLHHLCPADQEVVLSEAARVLRRGGTLILLEDTPASDADRRLIELADRRLNLEGKEEVHAYRRPEEWRACLEPHGFTVGASIPFTRVFPPATLRPVPHHAFVCTAPPTSG